MTLEIEKALETVEHQFHAGGEDQFYAALAFIRERLEMLGRERDFWRRQVGISSDTVLFFPAEGPPPQEAIELGRKLMEHYGEPERSIVRRNRAEVAEAREAALREALEKIAGGEYFDTAENVACAALATLVDEKLGSDVT